MVTLRIRATRASAIVGVIACSTADVTAPRPDLDCTVPDQVSSSIALTGVTVIPMDRDAALAEHTVLIQDGSIVAVGPDDTIDIPSSATVIDQCRGFLMPGLVDMHVHAMRAHLGAYVSSGITTVRNLWGYPALRELAAEVESGVTVGPIIYSVSPGLDGNPPKWPFTQTILDPALADSMVQAQVDAGWESLKLYQDLSRDVYDAIVVAAQTRDMEYVGHVPHRVGLEHALASGQRSIEHLSGYELALNGGTVGGAFGWSDIDETMIPHLVELTISSGAWNCPTLAIFSILANADETVVGNRRKMVKALHDAGARLLVGTDSGIEVTQPGISIHQELREFVAAGLTPYEALRGATADAGEFLDVAIGTVAVGYRADLVMLPGNPLDDVRVAEEPAFVMIGGRFVRSP